MENEVRCRALWERSYAFSPAKTLQAKLFRGKTLFALGHRDQGCAYYLQWLQEYPQSSRLRNNVGVCYVRLGRLADARDAWVHAAQKAYEDDDTEVHGQVGRNIKSLDDWTAAFRAQHGKRAPRPEEWSTLPASILW
uniref:Uncharacterized protein n=1 Tax=Globisporangium ultimum (strain ATCC 200006 / CBS 805.95 / DAOM BR144) TaxID=431595 RepID=K3WD77_GLOUD